MDITFKEAQKIIRGREYARTNKKWANWLFGGVVGVVILCLILLVVEIGIGYNPGTLVTVGNDPKEIEYDGNYLMVDGTVFAEKLYQMPDGSILKLEKSRLIKQNGDIVAKNIEFNDTRYPLLITIIILLAVGVISMFVIIGIQEYKVGKVADGQIEKYIKTGTVE